MVLHYIRERWFDWVIRAVALSLLYVAPWQGVGKILLILAFVGLDRALSARARRYRRAGSRLLEWRVANHASPAPASVALPVADRVFKKPASFLNDTAPVQEFRPAD